MEQRDSMVFMFVITYLCRITIDYLIRNLIVVFSILTGKIACLKLCHEVFIYKVNYFKRTSKISNKINFISFISVTDSLGFIVLRHYVITYKFITTNSINVASNIAFEFSKKKLIKNVRYIIV